VPDGVYEHFARRCRRARCRCAAAMGGTLCHVSSQVSRLRHRNRADAAP
jgi:hypothetical protein